jgi:hypothetical protein
MAKRKKTDFVQFKIRFRESLRSRLELAAKGQERSLNSEIVARLEQSFDREGLTRIRDQAERTLTSILEQNRRREYLAELEVKRLTEAFYESNPNNKRVEGLGELSDPMSDEEAKRGAPPRAREPRDETDEQRQARLRATAEGYRRNAERDETRGSTLKAARARQIADMLEREAATPTRGQAQEPELPMPSVTGRGRLSKGGKS